MNQPDPAEIETPARPLVETEAERIWFIGPIRGPGYEMMVSVEPGRYDRGVGAPNDRARYSRPAGFPWRSMDINEWGACYKPQGTTAMDYGPEWSVLSVADYTQDSRPNVMVIFAVNRGDVPEAEMRLLAAERYPNIWQRLGVTDA